MSDRTRVLEWQTNGHTRHPRRVAGLALLLLACVAGAVAGVALVGWGLADLARAVGLVTMFPGFSAIALGIGVTLLMGWLGRKVVLRAALAWWKVELEARRGRLTLRRTFLGYTASVLVVSVDELKQVEMVRGGLLLDVSRSVESFQTAPMPLEERIALLHVLQQIIQTGRIPSGLIGFSEPPSALRQLTPNRQGAAKGV